jgi:hypothetical protein
MLWHAFVSRSMSNGVQAPRRACASAGAPSGVTATSAAPSSRSALLRGIGLVNDRASSSRNVLTPR